MIYELRTSFARILEGTVEVSVGTFRDVAALIEAAAEAYQLRRCRGLRSGDRG